MLGFRLVHGKANHLVTLSLQELSLHQPNTMREAGLARAITSQEEKQVLRSTAFPDTASITSENAVRSYNNHPVYQQWLTVYKMQSY